MLSKVSLRSNPKLLFLFLIILVLPVVGVLCIFLFGYLVGAIAIAAALYIDYQMVKFTLNHLRSYIEITDTGLRCLTTTGENLEFSWEQITMAGSYQKPQDASSLFIYSDEADRFLKIPRDYSHFTAIEQELKQRTPFQRLILEEGVSLEDRLKEMMETNRSAVESEG